jgi:hypothetical protein
MNPSYRPNDSTYISPTGYASQRYAESLEEFGTVRELPACGGWLLISQTPNPNLHDATGCYPLFCCRNWAALRGDLESVAESLVSVRIVTDPFANVGISELNATFPDLCYEYKQHFVTDLALPLESFVASHHRRNVRKST